MSESIAVIGAGSWGTTLANLLAKKGYPVRVWSYEAVVAETINSSSENTRYLGGIELSPRLTAVTELREALDGADVVVSVSPAQHVRAIMTRAAEWIRDDAFLVSASKGIETATLETMSDVFEATVPDSGDRVSFLSGPSFALEVARERPTAVAVASRSEETARRTQALFQTDYFRVYTNTDVKGVELGGAIKNVIAIASGIVAGLELGHNATAALITRGLAEMTRLGVALGAEPQTFAGLAGMGDLVLTCMGSLSRNRTVGTELGRGRSLDEVLAEMTMVAEGVETARATRTLAREEGIEMPITEEVCAVLFEGKAPHEALETLMSRDPKSEFWG